MYLFQNGDNMLEDTIEELTKLLIKEEFGDSKDIYYKVSKKDLIRFCIKFVKVIQQIDNNAELLEYEK